MVNNNGSTCESYFPIQNNVSKKHHIALTASIIIPIVPYVDASNSCDQLLEQFDAAGFGNTFKRRFLQDVSLYLSDMRILSNIVNEYIIYHGRLNDSGLTTQPDRQLAMVIYKNLYPGDFDLLQHGRGYVFALFENKRILLENLRKQIDAKIDRSLCCLP